MDDDAVEAYVAWMIILGAWIAGIILAEGFFLTALAVVFPPYALLIVLFKLMLLCGLL